MHYWVLTRFQESWLCVSYICNALTTWLVNRFLLWPKDVPCIRYSFSYWMRQTQGLKWSEWDAVLAVLGNKNLYMQALLSAQTQNISKIKSLFVLFCFLLLKSVLFYVGFIPMVAVWLTQAPMLNVLNFNFSKKMALSSLNTFNMSLKPDSHWWTLDCVPSSDLIDPSGLVDRVLYLAYELFTCFLEMRVKESCGDNTQWMKHPVYMSY